MKACYFIYKNLIQKSNYLLENKNYLINQNQRKKMSNEFEKAKNAFLSEDTIFGKIIRKEIKSEFIYEDDICIAINDINPIAPVHFLVIPKKPIPQLSMVEESDEHIIGHLFFVVRKLVEKTKINKSGFRTVINDGKDGCQSVYHLHIHVIGGKQLGWPPC